jgi:hypothetical protein
MDFESAQDRMCNEKLSVVPVMINFRYINAEVSGGGFPGWLQRNSAHLRTNETGFLEATYKSVMFTRFIK